MGRAGDAARRRGRAGTACLPCGGSLRRRVAFVKKSRALVVALALAVASSFAAADVRAFDPHSFFDEGEHALAADAFEGCALATPGEGGARTVDCVVARMTAADLHLGLEFEEGRRTRTRAVPLRLAKIIGEPALSLPFGGKAETPAQDARIVARVLLDGSPEMGEPVANTESRAIRDRAADQHR